MKKFLISLVQLFFKTASKIEAVGLENIPDEGPVIMAANHIGFLDGFFILALKKIADNPNLVVIVAEKWEEIAIFRWAAKTLDWMFVDRYNPDIKTMRKLLQRMKNDGLLVIAPEGTRSPNAELIEGKPGAAYVAAKTKTKIVPAGITGTEEKLYIQKLKSFKRLDIKIIFGEPFELPPMPKDDRDEFLKNSTDEIMCQIAVLLPPSYRGLYADHPRLHEILSSKTND